MSVVFIRVMKVNKASESRKYDIIVIGAGHAGCEAGLVCARLGMETAMFCTDIDSVAMMP